LAGPAGAAIVQHAATPKNAVRKSGKHRVSWETLQIVIVLALVAVVFFGMVREVIAPDVLALCGAALLLLLGILNTSDVLRVFSNPAPFTVGALFVLSGALERTGVIDALGQFIARVPWKSPTQALLVMMSFCLVLSAFINNTPIVVILTPVVIRLAHTVKVAPSRMLMPLSFAAILGGTCSLIGTSTNIVVDGVAQSHGMASFGLFEISGPGMIYGVVGILYLYFIGRRFLPDRPTLSDTLIDVSQRKFLTEALVPQGSPLIGKTLSDAGLTSNRGVLVIDLIREERSFDPEHGEPALAAGDRLILRTSVADFMGLRDAGTVVGAGSQHALEPITTRDLRMMEGIVGPRSSFVGQRVADLNLRRLYDTRILAIHRRNENLHGKLDQVRLQFGDSILLEGSADGLKRLFDRQEMINLTEVTERPFRRNKAWIAIAAVLAVIVLSAFEAMPIAATSFIAACVVVGARCLDPDEAYKAIHWPILMLIFGMMAIGAAMETSGAGPLIVKQLVGVVGSFGPIAVLSLVYFLTSFFTEFMSHNATAVLITPIAIGLAEQMGVDPRPFVVAVMFAASASFATPIGYATNTLVYAAGGYRFTDFVRVGLPLNLLLWIVASFILPLFWRL
jgi:di/tricarboxylate transporter